MSPWSTLVTWPSSQPHTATRNPLRTRGTSVFRRPASNRLSSVSLENCPPYFYHITSFLSHHLPLLAGLAAPPPPLPPPPSFHSLLPSSPSLVFPLLFHLDASADLLVPPPRPALAGPLRRDPPAMHLARRARSRALPFYSRNARVSPALPASPCSLPVRSIPVPAPPIPTNRTASPRRGGESRALFPSERNRLGGRPRRPITARCNMRFCSNI